MTPQHRHSYIKFLNSGLLRACQQVYCELTEAQFAHKTYNFHEQAYSHHVRKLDYQAIRKSEMEISVCIAAWKAARSPCTANLAMSA